MYTWLVAFMVILSEKGYTFSKWIFSPSAKFNRQESSRFQSLASSSEQVGDSL
jgi:hypothetical protein